MKVGYCYRAYDDEKLTHLFHFEGDFLAELYLMMDSSFA